MTRAPIEPCAFYQRKEDVKMETHGDDSNSIAEGLKDAKWMKEFMETNFTFNWVSVIFSCCFFFVCTIPQFVDSNANFT